MFIFPDGLFGSLCSVLIAVARCMVSKVSKGEIHVISLGWGDFGWKDCTLLQRFFVSFHFIIIFLWLILDGIGWYFWTYIIREGKEW